MVGATSHRLRDCSSAAPPIVGLIDKGGAVVRPLYIFRVASISHYGKQFFNLKICLASSLKHPETLNHRASIRWQETTMNAVPENFSGSTHDPDPQETQEWLDALEGVIQREGPERAHALLEQLIEQTRRSGA
jgi:hypothetical protein